MTILYRKLEPPARITRAWVRPPIVDRTASSVAAGNGEGNRIDRILRITA
jgi:hypothetical protein